MYTFKYLYLWGHKEISINIFNQYTEKLGKWIWDVNAKLLPKYVSKSPLDIKQLIYIIKSSRAL